MSRIKSLIKQLNETSEKLSKENKEIFDEIVVYVRTSNIKTSDTEEFLQQILDSFLNAEKRGVTIKEVLGTSDIKEYCKEIVNTYKSSYNLLSRLNEYILFLGIIIIIFPLMNFIFQNSSSIIQNGIDTFTFSLNVNLAIIIQVILIALLVPVVMAYVQRSCFKRPTKSDKIKEFLVLCLINILIILVFVLCSKFLSNSLSININIFIILIVGLPLYFTGKYLTEK